MKNRMAVPLAAVCVSACQEDRLSTTGTWSETTDSADIEIVKNARQRVRGSRGVSGRSPRFPSESSKARIPTCSVRLPTPPSCPRPQAARSDGIILSIPDWYESDSSLVELRDGEGVLSSSLGWHPDNDVIVAKGPGGHTEPVPAAYSRELVVART